MATLKELLAAKAAAKTPAKGATAVATTNVVDDDPSLTEAIDRIDPPGKRKPASLVLSNAAEAQPAQAPLPESWQEGRALGRTQGEAIPMIPTDAAPTEAMWHYALAALETELCVMQHPSDPETCWLALRPLASPPREPLLLHRLPWLLYPAKPTNGQPF